MDILEEAEHILKLAEATKMVESFDEVWKLCSWELFDDTGVKKAAKRLYDHCSKMYQSEDEDSAVKYLMNREKAMIIGGFASGVLWERKRKVKANKR